MLISQVSRIKNNMTNIDKLQMRERLSQVQHEQSVLRRLTSDLTVFNSMISAGSNLSRPATESRK